MKTTWIAALGVLLPSAAWACGGLFCSNSPVDQNAERILFEVNGDGTISTYVDISYTGNPEDFSWVVPVSESPQLDVVTASGLQLLDAASRVVFQGPPTNCDPGFSIFRSDELAAGNGGGEDGILVDELPRVGPYDPLVVSGGTADEMIAWLNTNGYVITEEMEPFVTAYAEAGSMFLAMKLSADAQTADIAPIKMTYASTAPMIPLELTAVAAEPEMGVIVMIAGADNYRADNWFNVEIETDQIQVDPSTGQNNYFALVSQMIDEAGGEAFVTQYSGPSNEIDPTAVFLGTLDAEAAATFATAVLARQPRFTRMYARVSAWEMNNDPVFVPSDAPDLSNVHNLMDRPVINVCGNTPPRVPCGDTYCGDGAQCASTSANVDGCVCAEGFAARAITNPLSAFLPTVTCQPVSFDLLQSIAPAIGSTSVCRANTCGEHGVCVARGGFATCQCDDGYAAHPDPDGLEPLVCSSVTHLYEASQLQSWSTGCQAAPAFPLLAAAWLGALAWRRGTRRRPRG